VVDLSFLDQLTKEAFFKQAGDKQSRYMGANLSRSYHDYHYPRVRRLSCASISSRASGQYLEATIMSS